MLTACAEVSLSNTAGLLGSAHIIFRVALLSAEIADASGQWSAAFFMERTFPNVDRCSDVLNSI